MQRLFCSAGPYAPPRFPASLLAHLLEMKLTRPRPRTDPYEVLALLGLLSIVLDAAGDLRPDD